DHVADVDRIYQNNEHASVISNFEIVNWFNKKGIEKYYPMNHGGTWKLDFGAVKMVNAIHSSSLPDGSHGGNPAGFVVKADGKTFYFAGDTALHQDMKQIKEDFNVDFAFLPIGDIFTMGIEDALKCASYVGAKKIIAMHYDTFPYIKIDHDHVKNLAQKAGKELLLLKIGAELNL
ncbi:metal-dependent hydrolase, partial [Xanthovirga aplysinae]|uniref:metal-dependent hydrolase n=1 Tax=Xanthovirga aplysinae TaxID=2529853 RepID=UPI0012BC81D2